MQNEVLEKNSDPNLRVYAVWYNMFPTDAKERWPQRLIDDSRVIHFWDDNKLLGRWYGQHPDYLNSNRTYWDAYLLYGPESTWSEKPSALVRWGGTIVAKRDELRESTQEALARRRAASE